jgi:hypothetical protein
MIDTWNRELFCVVDLDLVEVGRHVSMHFEYFIGIIDRVYKLKLFGHYYLRITVHAEQAAVLARSDPGLHGGEGSGAGRANLRHQEQHSSGNSHMTQAKEANEVWSILKEDHYFWYNADKVLALCKID